MTASYHFPPKIKILDRTQFQGLICALLVNIRAQNIADSYWSAYQFLAHTFHENRQKFLQESMDDIL